MEDAKEAARREIGRLVPAIESAKLVDAKGAKLLELAKAYASDAKHFFSKGKNLDAFEAVVIAWAYVDAGIHLGVLTVDHEFDGLFTV